MFPVWRRYQDKTLALRREMMKKLIVGILIAVLNNRLLFAQDNAVAYVGADKTSLLLGKDRRFDNVL
jgi:hypothetical protein